MSGRLKVLLKFAGGALFTAVGCVCSALAGASARLWAPLIAGLLAGVAGDFLLAIKNIDEKKHETALFLGGMAAFFAGHIAYIFYYCAIDGHGWPVPLVAAASAALFVVITYKALRFSYGGLLAPCAIYSFAVVYSFAAAAAAAVSVAGIVAAVGAGLFLFSDIILAFYIFSPAKNIRPLGAVNLAVYFSAQTLIALSILFI